MTIDIAEVRRLTNLLLDHLEQQGVRSVDIVHDHYWDIPPDHRYDVLAKPTEFTIGQLSEDLDNLRSIEVPTNEPLGYALVWLAQLLREIGETHVG